MCLNSFTFFMKYDVLSVLCNVCTKKNNVKTGIAME